MEDKETSRLEAFSDAVFAVAITLLVLNIKVPGLDLPPSQLPNDPLSLNRLILSHDVLVKSWESSFSVGILCLCQLMFKRIARRCTARIESQLAEDRMDVSTDGVGTQDKTPGDLS